MLPFAVKSSERVGFCPTPKSGQAILKWRFAEMAESNVDDALIEAFGAQAIRGETHIHRALALARGNRHGLRDQPKQADADRLGKRK